MTMREDDILPDLDLDLDGLFDGDAEDVETQTRITPRVLKHASKQRMLALAKRQHLHDVMPELPEPGYVYHVVSDGRWDYWTWIPRMLDWLGGRADEVYISTWTMSRPNCVDLLRLIDEGRIGRVSMLTGLYFKRRESSVYAMLLTGLHKRGGRYVALPCHAKVALLRNKERGAWLVVEGSANLTGNPRIEQFTLCNDREVYSFHREWMEQCLTTKRPDEPTAALKPKRKGYSMRRAGLGVLAVTTDPQAREKVLTWKRPALEDAGTTRELAGDLADLITEAIPTLPKGTMVTSPPQGASEPGLYYAEALGKAVADVLAVEYRTLLARTDTKTEHGPMKSLQQKPYAVTTKAGAALVVDDLTTSGTTMKLALEALRAAGVPAWGFAYSGV